MKAMAPNQPKSHTTLRPQNNWNDPSKWEEPKDVKAFQPNQLQSHITPLPQNNWDEPTKWEEPKDLKAPQDESKENAPVLPTEVLHTLGTLGTLAETGKPVPSSVEEKEKKERKSVASPVDKATAADAAPAHQAATGVPVPPTERSPLQAQQIPAGQVEGPVVPAEAIMYHITGFANAELNTLYTQN